MESTLQFLADLVGGKITAGDPDLTILGFQSLSDAGDTDISFFGNEKYLQDLKESKAAAILVPPPSAGEFVTPEAVALIEVENPILAFDTIIREFGVAKPAFRPGIHPSASIGENCKIDPGSVSILPNAVVFDGSKIGSGTRIGAGAVVGENCEIGSDCEIGPNVSLREGSKIGDRVIIHSGVVIGGDGYGFEFADGRHQKIEQLGIVRVENDVEIGANTTIDRARFGETVIGEGTKIDNLCQIAHNVVIGKHCLVVAQTGISGSTRIGNYVTLAAQCGVAGHLTIADQTICGARSGVISSIKESGGTWFGYPAKPIKESRRESMRIKQLGRVLERIKALEEKPNQQS
ncbi:MAG: UDP-3-O-(3-hydroxymyristoyl)glucosamine N-acyltransferase [Verrucomicrobiales bacterium]|nr:UDP-3-O-(3-hydroxymyristoyl)glucosamine N-acyltransferase [Verrucomicrobiales bacterium]